MLLNEILEMKKEDIEEAEAAKDEETLDEI